MCCRLYFWCSCFLVPTRACNPVHVPDLGLQDIPPESDYEPEEPIKKIPVSVITGFLGYDSPYDSS